MRYLVTGARGFIGAAVVRAALEAGHNVAVLVRPNAVSGRLTGIENDIVWIHGDLLRLDAPETRAACHAFAPDVVVHAAWEGVSSADRNAEWQTNRNVAAATDLMAMAADCGATHFIGLGSQAEYGPCSGRIPEDQALCPTTRYGEAKVAACIATQHEAHSRHMQHSWLRVFSTYGPGSDANWVLPMAAGTMARGAAPELTRCEQRWEFLHVRDAAAAVIAVAARRAPGIFNLGSGDARPLRDVMLMLRDRIAPGITPKFGAVEYRPDQVMYLEADIGRLHVATGWLPVVRLESGLDEIASEALKRAMLEGSMPEGSMPEDTMLDDTNRKRTMIQHASVNAEAAVHPSQVAHV